MTKKWYQNGGSIHKKSKTKHKNNSLGNQLPETLQRAYKVFLNTVLWQKRKYFRSWRQMHLILSFIHPKYIHRGCTSPDALQRESEPPKAPGLISCGIQATGDLQKHVNSFSTQDSGRVSQGALAATGELLTTHVNQPVAAWRGYRAPTQASLRCRYQEMGKM